MDTEFGSKLIILEPPREAQTVHNKLDTARPKPKAQWYIITAKWWQNWKSYVDFDKTGESGPRPDPIDNFPILSCQDPPLLKLELQLKRDVEVIPEEVWNKFTIWYGGGPKIPRPCLEVGSSRRIRVELYPVTLTVLECESTGRMSQISSTVQVSPTLTVQGLRMIIASKRSHPPHRCRIWGLSEDADGPMDPKGWELLSYDAQTIEELCWTDGQKVLFEKQSMTGDWPRENVSETNSSSDFGSNSYMKSYSSSYRSSTSSTAGYSSGYSYTSRYQHSLGKPKGLGLTGLNNLGNTCFMNSALQCLSNTSGLTNYFLTETFAPDINLKNPLGTKGKLATHYGILLKRIWSMKYQSVAPTEFKKVLGNFAPQFAGYHQQDSQELLAFLLDGLHEDLNKVPEPKPYVEAIESDGRKDSIVVDEAWQGYLSRNKSVIVNLFQGQFRSRVTCPIDTCDRVSITFDPFMYLSIPLPAQNIRKIDVTLIHPSSPPTLYRLSIPKRCPVSEIKREMSKTLKSEGIDLLPQQMEVGEIYTNKVWTVYPDTRSAYMIRSNEMTYAFVLKERDRVEQEIEVAQKKKERKIEIAKRKREKQKKQKEKQKQKQKQKGKEKEEVTQEVKDEEGDTEMIDTSVPLPSVISLPPPSSFTTIEEEEEEEEEDLPVVPNLPSLTVVYVQHEKKDLVFSNFSTPFLLCIDPLQTTGNQLHTLIRNYIQCLGLYSPNSSTGSSIGSSIGSSTLDMETDGPDLLAGAGEEKEEQKTKQENDEEEKGVPLYEVHWKKGYSKQGIVEESNLVLGEDWRSDSFSTKIVVEIRWNKTAAKFVKEMKVIKHESVIKEEDTTDTKLTLQNCLELFIKEEQLSKQDSWYCNKCKEFREAFKKFDLWKLPRVLVIHLKRFTYTETFRDKLEHFVHYPISGLDLSDMIKGPQTKPLPKYNLFAVSLHSGGLSFGHYTAMALNHKNGKWYEYNDSSVSEVKSEASLISKDAYLLFYEREDTVEEATDYEFDEDTIKANLKVIGDCTENPKPPVYIPPSTTTTTSSSSPMSDTDQGSSSGNIAGSLAGVVAGKDPMNIAGQDVSVPAGFIPEDTPVTAGYDPQRISNVAGDMDIDSGLSNNLNDLD